ncbi:MarR family winged helix-turn-helix transcriptional regulator [Listeria monocytogenes]|jgi:transcriptional regulator, MarR family|uniref:Lmo2726 protein n=5 Tax=Listeria monocytogenes TaxID=1639 RepID=Q8Y3V5_LISMO|nr:MULTISPECIES: MarR family transcriptional regulator [Listeria]NP_466248.1 MarR family transcriptional regulator [Listeria monocytogenes EGD-e]EAE1679323.1 MarR family transcriptional regulator [Listeria monocytogenes LIS0071]EAE3702806.1 MarR family transcriptional regulator [Listeria monocytogenes serotype 1/2c]EAE3705034.1 MarR family transcriptional regulator [Listeria monocytogenes serotype 1/2b]EAE6067627.1 MarR family transcriptional regulator [Listeria monocytogenes serotype 1/2a]EA
MADRQESLAKAIAIIHRSESTFKNKKLLETGLNIGQLRYLWTLYKEDGISQESMAKRFMVDKASVTRHIKRLEELGMIRREIDAKDRRIQRIFVTETGFQMRDLIEEVTAEWSALLTANFSEKEKDDLMHLIGRLSDNAIIAVEGGESE